MFCMTAAHTVQCKGTRACRFCAFAHRTCQSASIDAAVIGLPDPAAAYRDVEIPTKEVTNSRSLRIEHVPAVVCAGLGSMDVVRVML